MNTENKNNRDKNRNIITVLIAAALVAVALCICAICIAGGAILFTTKSGTQTTPAPHMPPTYTPIPTPTPISTGEVLPPKAQETLETIRTSEIPEADLHELGIRFLSVSPDTSRTASSINPDYSIGTVRTFIASNLDADETFEIQAELVYKTDHVYMWVEEGVSRDVDAIREAAELFENHTYPTNRAFFGSEWTPGVDGDPHLSVLHAENLGNTVAGYFSSADSYVKAVREDSNEMEMFYIHASPGMEVGMPFYNGVLAHEFQHMIHWYNDRNETTWLNEGCSELAMELNNRMYPRGQGMYEVGDSEYAYLNQPDTQLNTWPEVSTTGSASPHYGASYLFLAYFLDRFGNRATQALVRHDLNGMESVDAVLRDDLSLNIAHADVFADWTVANLLDAPTLDQGQYGYDSIDISLPTIDQEHGGWGLSPYPVEERSTVKQYGVDYIRVSSRSPLELNFVGSDFVPLMDTDPYGGEYLWWSNRADESNTKLTRVINLPHAERITLDFWAWYHIEEDWDYAYVVVGSSPTGSVPNNLDGDEIQWKILEDDTLNCTSSNPNNGNLGCGLTGKSAGWQNLTADLTEYQGQEIALRFEYITDAAVNQAGLGLDDIKIEVESEVITYEDAEGENDAWIAEGFVRHANILPQDWIVQLIWNDDPPEVERLLFLDKTYGKWVIPFDRDRDEAFIAISALAPTTTEMGSYEYALRPAK